MNDFDKRAELFKAEVMALGEKYKIALVGTCNLEGITGEITIVDMEAAPYLVDYYWNFDY